MTPPSRRVGVDYSVAAPLALVHLLAFALGPFTVSLEGVVVCAVLFLVTGLGVTAGAHRLFTHRAYSASPLVREGLAFAFLLGAQGSLGRWVRDHRIHHRFTDEAGDPHSPRHGFVHAHLGWLWRKPASRAEARELYERWATGLDDVVVARTFSSGPALSALHASSALALYLAAEAFGGSGISVVVWGVAVRIILVQHCTFLVNSAAHRWGEQGEPAGHDARNNGLVALLALGEGWHANHHAHPSAANQGWNLRQPDVTFAFLVLLGRMGLVHDLKVWTGSRLEVWFASPRSLPGPPPHLLLGAYGNLLALSRDVMGTVDTLFREHGALVAVVGGDLASRPKLTRWLFAYGPEHARTFLTQHDVWHKPPMTKHLYPQGENLGPRMAALQRWGSGLFGVNEEEHKEHRRLLMPAFQKRRVEARVQTMVDITADELAGWRPGAVVDVRQSMTALTLRIASVCLLGEDIETAGRENVGTLLQSTIRSLLQPSVAILPLDVPGTPYRRFLDGVVRTDDALRAIIARRRQNPGGTDVLSALIEASESEASGMTEEQLIGHAGVVFIAGHETSSNALMWTLLLLSQHPGVAVDLVDEIAGVVGAGPPDCEQLARLPLLDAVVRESMRLLPAVPVTVRVLGRETEVRGVPVPVGTQLLLSNYHTHRMSELYDAPMRFNPRRWETLKPGPFEYIPFGTGPRVCIGAQFAQLEMKVVLTMILQRFRLELPRNTRVDRFLAVAMTVRGALPMRVHPQDRAFSANERGFVGTVRPMVAWPN